MVNTLMTASGNTGVVVLHEGAGQSHVVLAMINRLVRPYDKNYPAGRFRSISSIMLFLGAFILSYWVDSKVVADER